MKVKYRLSVIRKTVLFSWTSCKDLEDPKVPQTTFEDRVPPCRGLCGSSPAGSDWLVSLLVPRVVSPRCALPVGRFQKPGQGLHFLTVGTRAKRLAGPQCPRW